MLSVVIASLGENLNSSLETLYKIQFKDDK